MSEVLEFIRHIINPEWILGQPGAFWLLLFVIFAETGLFVGFFLPGDSLLFVTGMVLSRSNIHVWDDISFSVLPVILCVIAMGIIGNYVGYWFGYKSGPALFKKQDSLLFKQKHLSSAKQFYDERGAMVIIMARFLPIVRTFSPIVAGIVQMEWSLFSMYNITGCIAWVASLILSGYFLGTQFPSLGDHLDLIVICIILITTLPVIIGYLTQRTKA
jgi:membrane-associated protein